MGVLILILVGVVVSRAFTFSTLMASVPKASKAHFKIKPPLYFVSPHPSQKQKNQSSSPIIIIIIIIQGNNNNVYQ